MARATFALRAFYVFCVATSCMCGATAKHVSSVQRGLSVLLDIALLKPSNLSAATADRRDDSMPNISMVPEAMLPAVDAVFESCLALLDTWDDLEAGSDADDVAVAAKQHWGALKSSISQLPEGPSAYPMTRRMVMFTLHRIFTLYPLLYTKTQFSQQTLTVDVKAAFLQLHRAAHLQRDATVQHIHIPKSGGMTFCTEVQALNISTGTGPSCTVDEFHDHPAAWPFEPILPYQRAGEVLEELQGVVPQATCDERSTMLKQKNIAMFSNEFTLPSLHGDAPRGSGAMCPQFLNVVQLREPVARALSHYNNWKRDSCYVHDNWSQLPPRLPFVASFLVTQKDSMPVFVVEKHYTLPTTFRSVRTFVPYIFDNFNIRTLLGQKTFFAPCGSLTTAHLNAAKINLAAMDLVLLLESPNTAMQVLSGALGWRVDLANKVNSNPDTVEADEEEHPWAQHLRRTNMLDSRLYNTARFLHALDALLFAGAQVELGLS